jgi:hypothetical protein
MQAARSEPQASEGHQGGSHRRLVRLRCADDRLSVARAWLRAREPSEELLVVGANAPAAAELVRRAALDAGWRVRSGTAPPPRGSPRRSRRARSPRAVCVPVGRLVSEAVVAQVLHELGEQGDLGSLCAAPAAGPGSRARSASVLEEVRAEALDRSASRLVAPNLARVSSAYDGALARAGSPIAPRSERLASEAVRAGRALARGSICRSCCSTCPRRAPRCARCSRRWSRARPRVS